jgi:hypothetical protein
MGENNCGQTDLWAFPFEINQLRLGPWACALDNARVSTRILRRKGADWIRLGVGGLLPVGVVM